MPFVSLSCAEGNWDRDVHFKLYFNNGCYFPDSAQLNLTQSDVHYFKAVPQCADASHSKCPKDFPESVWLMVPRHPSEMYIFLHGS